jgi:hypothetical protein
LKRRNPSSVKAAGERSSQAQNAVSARPAALIYFAACAKPSASGSNASKRTRSISNPESAAAPLEYWNTAGMKA